ncbi:hypothetical protein ACKLNO_10835 [Neisseriaceae bacterium B1]
MNNNKRLPENCFGFQAAFWFESDCFTVVLINKGYLNIFQAA